MKSPTTPALIALSQEDPSNQKLYVSILEMFGFQVIEHQTPNEIKGRSDISAIIADLRRNYDPTQMEINAQDIRALRGYFPQTPILVLSTRHVVNENKCGDRTRKLVREVGADEYLLKPTPNDVVKDTLDRMLRPDYVRAKFIFQ